MSTLNYASTIAGGGKTFSIIRAAIHRSKTGRNTAICVPTLVLAEEVRRLLEEQDDNCKLNVFHRDDGGEGAVTNRVRAYLDTCKPNGQILIITHQCFDYLPYFARKASWRVFFDENISVFETNTVNLPENHGIITDHMAIISTGSTYGRVTVTDTGRLRTVVENKNNDAAWALVRDFGSVLLDENYDSYVKIKQFTDLVEGRKQEGQLTIYSLRKPDKFLGFEQVTFASANFEDTLAFNYWKRLGVNWIEDSEISSSVIRREHHHSPNLQIYYGYDGRNSKALRNRLEKSGNNELWEKARELMRGEPYLWLENKDREETSILRQEGPMLPPGCAGLNTYSHIRHAIILPAYNYDPGQSDFLSKVAWFEKEMQERAMNLNLYQAFMRTAIRKGDVGEEARWVVACKRDADLLSERFPGSVIKPLGLTPLPERKVGRPKVYNGNQNRRHKYEERKKEQLARSADFVGDLGPEFLRDVVFHDTSDKSTLRSIGNFVRNYRGSYFHNYFDKEPQNVTMNERRFVSWLKQLSTNSYKSKDDIPCISGALFDPRRSSENTRHTKNVALCRGIWIDIELGDMTVKQFERAFPHIQFVAFNTFRHTKQEPRYRIYIPTDRPMYFEESVAIYHEVRYSLKNQGWINGKRNAKPSASFNRSFDGIDCRPNPSLLSILPCQTQSGKESFFHDLTKGKEPLNVDAWLDQRSWFQGDDDFYDLPPFNYNNQDAALTQEQELIIVEATNRWETFGRSKGNGDAGIFTLYIALRQAKIPYHEIQWRLLNAATQSTSPNDRRKQVQDLLKKVKH